MEKNKKTPTFSKKSVFILAELCSGWGYTRKITKVRSFVSYLDKKGYKTDLKIVPTGTGLPIYNIFQCVFNDDGSKMSLLPLFSNDKLKYSNSAVLSEKLEKDMFEQMEKAIK